MGYMRHHAIIVTSWDEGRIIVAHAEARSVFPVVSGLMPSQINGYSSFFVPPDGSKEGWEESMEGDSRRAQYVEWLNSQRYDDGSTSLDWCEVQYGDEEGDDKVVSSSSVAIS